MNKRILSCILIFVISFFSLSTFAEGSTISVKLSNFIGNSKSIDITTTGSYKLANGNIRLSGSDRFQVANNVASSGWNKSNSVVVVNYLAFADALAASPFAYYKDAPILLTLPNSLKSETLLKINELAPQTIYIIGGTGSVSATVESQLRGMAQNVIRIGGKDRYEVSKNIAAEIPNNGGAVVANGLVFSDALSIAPYAARTGYPILLTAKDKLPDATKLALQGKQNTLVIGGEGSVSAAVAGQLPNSSRIGGADRYEVSANIIRQLNLPAETAFVSTGLTFADALTGSVLAAKQNAPLLLTRPDRLPDSIRAVINERSISSFTILGGTGSVSEAVVSSLPNEVWLAQNAAYSVKNENGRLALFQGSERIKDFGTAPFTLLPAGYGDQHQIKINNRPYIGQMDFTLENGNVRPINRNIPFEDYLKGVVPREMPASWSLEALKAQAVAARTYSIDDMGKVVADTQGYQVYGGYSWGKDPYEQRTNQAVEETRGKVLKYNGNLISAVFSSSNGGYIESNTGAWGTAQVPYLQAKPDSFDPINPWSIPLKKTQIDLNALEANKPGSLKNPGWWWTSTTPAEKDSAIAAKLKAWLQNKGFANTEIKIVSIDGFEAAPQRTAGNRAINATIKMTIMVKDKATNQYRYNSLSEIDRIPVEITDSVGAFRSLFGTGVFKSTLLDPTTYDAGTDTLTIRGKGFGHGVGMSQFGANNMAKQGFKYDEILRHYYPGASLVNY
ncbi:hypothetical protein A8F94_10790 [Bacillus sp. FJAT-27225]|uniref:SpoIID/LytB domain-containing protein n=1 Tax=Bacillus sp. FJAT-27225 TaxID=1743144 RepID=UPI00080C29FA|nr:SpoIID/LytB domain-containing protein [Bacillus sp. FJAT-27225]OCA88276.1 hypothetical protein A8F94_10790 [Bacillus sp. FJAT-27225]